MIADLAAEGSECTDGHTGRKSRCRNVDGILGSPFDRHFLGIDKQYFRTDSAVKTKFEAFQAGQERNDLGLNVKTSLICENTFHFSIIEENCILPRTDNQAAAFLDLPVAPFPEQHIISVFFPLYHIGKLISK